MERKLEMASKVFKPSPKYLTKMRLGINLLGLLVLVCGVGIALIINLGEDPDTGVAALIAVLFVVMDAIWWLPGLLLTGPYYRSLSYEIQDDEVIVRAGIWTKSVKHVPYRTVTNVQVKRDIVDRMLGIGTLNIQTAGMSGTTGAEESLVGLANVDEVYGLVAGELRRFRRAMAPTAAGTEAEIGATPADVLSGILDEVRAIRQTLEKTGRE
jgi:uncharacterized membrane protein YdbT with pleckstrin-like domain